MTGQHGQALTELLGLNRQDRAARTGLSGQDSLDRRARTEREREKKEGKIERRIEGGGRDGGE
jgi:hypothetical protein